MSLPEAVWREIDDGRPPTVARLRSVLAEDAVLLGEDGVAVRREHLAAQVLGLGPLEPLLTDPAVTDILVNGATGVWVDRGSGLESAGTVVGDEAAVRRLAVRLAGQAGRRLDDSSPYVDGLLANGVRLHAMLPPLAERVQLSLRVARRAAPTLPDLAALGGLDGTGVELLRALVRSRRSFLLTGGTGSGKTTLLSALLAEVPPTERIVVVEDVRELSVRHPHVVRLETRPANVEGYGEVDMAALVRQSLRMRPDRLVVGEVRGAEVRELLTALNTGHEGGCGTLHANAPADVVARVEALGALAGLSPAAVRAQLRSAVGVVVHLRRQGAVRELGEMSVVHSGGGGGVTIEAGVVARAGPPGMSPERSPGAASPGADSSGVRSPSAAPPAAESSGAESRDGGSSSGSRLTRGPAWPALARLLDLDPDAVR